jgi:hypothetical protein
MKPIPRSNLWVMWVTTKSGLEPWDALCKAIRTFFYLLGVLDNGHVLGDIVKLDQQISVGVSSGNVK